MAKKQRILCRMKSAKNIPFRLQEVIAQSLLCWDCSLKITLLNNWFRFVGQFIQWHWWWYPTKKISQVFYFSLWKIRTAFTANSPQHIICMLQTKMVDSVDFLFRPATLFKWEGKLVRHAEPFHWLTVSTSTWLGKMQTVWQPEIKPADWADSVNMIWWEKI